MAEQPKKPIESYTKSDDASLTPAGVTVVNILKNDILHAAENELEVNFEKINGSAPDIVIRKAGKKNFELTREALPLGTPSPTEMIARSFNAEARAETRHINGLDNIVVFEPKKVNADPNSRENKAIQSDIKNAMALEKDFVNKVFAKRTLTAQQINESKIDDAVVVTPSADNSYTLEITGLTDKERAALVNKVAAKTKLLKISEQSGKVVVDVRRDWQNDAPNPQYSTEVKKAFDEAFKSLKESRVAQDDFIKQINGLTTQADDFKRQADGSFSTTIKGVTQEQAQTAINKAGVGPLFTVKAVETGVELNLKNVDSFAEPSRSLLPNNIAEGADLVSLAALENKTKIEMYNRALEANGIKIVEMENTGKFILNHTFREQGAQKQAQDTANQINSKIKSNIASAVNHEGNYIVMIDPTKLPTLTLGNMVQFSDSAAPGIVDNKRLIEKFQKAKEEIEANKIAAQKKIEQEQEKAKEAAKEPSKTQESNPTPADTKIAAPIQTEPQTPAKPSFFEKNAAGIFAGIAGFIGLAAGAWSGMGGMAVLVGAVAAAIGAVAGPRLMEAFTSSDSNVTPPAVPQGVNISEKRDVNGLLSEHNKALDRTDGKVDGRFAINDLDMNRNGYISQIEMATILNERSKEEVQNVMKVIAEQGGLKIDDNGIELQPQSRPSPRPNSSRINSMT